MNRVSAVEFTTSTRIHIGLAVKDINDAITFYRDLFGQEPSKTRSGYAKFEVAEPPVNLAINQVRGATGPNNPVAHYGIQVKSSEAVVRMKERLAAAGVTMTVEVNITCCYAVQDKIWVADPDGNKWEVFVVLDNEGSQHSSQSGACCSDAGGEFGACCSDAVKPAGELMTLGCCR